MRLPSPPLMALLLGLFVACGDGGDPNFGRAKEPWQIDDDGDGVTADDDCDDGDPSVTPDTTEICDGIDNDCDELIDEDGTPDALVWYLDADADGFGAGAGKVTCYPDDGYVTNDDDCDDSDDDRFPGNQETCDGFDEDCDGQADEGAIDPTEWYADLDEDGYGDAENIRRSCEQPPGYLLYGTDCEDADATINPAADEVCDGVDNDCDEQTDEIGEELYRDADGDGFGDPAWPITLCDEGETGVEDDDDCDDSSEAIHPDAEEIVDGLDNDCDGEAL